MGRSDEYRRFAAECLKIAHATGEEQHRATFMKMAQVWLDLARKDEANSDRGDGSSEEKIN
jgi:phage terminase large subunit-like protein